LADQYPEFPVGRNPRHYSPLRHAVRHAHSVLRPIDHTSLSLSTLIGFWHPAQLDATSAGNTYTTLTHSHQLTARNYVHFLSVARTDRAALSSSTEDIHTTNRRLSQLAAAAMSSIWRRLQITEAGWQFYGHKVRCRTVIN